MPSSPSLAVLHHPFHYKTVSDLFHQVCCAGFSSTFRYPSIGFYYVPTSWNLEVRGHGWQNGQYCATLLDRQTINGATNRCLSGHSFAGAGYSFRSKKRADAQACTSTQKADVLTMGNGNRYNITGLRGGQLDELVALAVNGTAAIDVPELFMAFEYKQ